MCLVEIKLNIDCAEDDHHHVCLLPLCHPVCNVHVCLQITLVNICNAGKAAAAAHLSDDRTSHQAKQAVVQKDVAQQCGSTRGQDRRGMLERGGHGMGGWPR